MQNKNLPAQMATTSKLTQTADEDLNKAIQRLYEKYGPNLSAFYRDVQHGLELQKREIEHRRKSALR